MVEQTLVVFKPDTIKRAIVGEIITRFERVGLKIIGAKMIQVSEQLAYEHYEKIGGLATRFGDGVYKVNADFMMSGPVLAVVLEGIEAIAVVRKMLGSTSPKDALPGTIRGDYAHISREYANDNSGWLPNILHASANSEEAQKELNLWFSGAEIFEHEDMNQLFKRGHK